MPLPNDGSIKCRYTDCEKLFDSFAERENHYRKEHSNRHKLDE